MPDQHRHASSPDLAEQSLGRSDRIGHRLFDRYRHASLDTIQRHRKMHRIRRGNDLSIWPCSVEQRQAIGIPGSGARLGKGLRIKRWIGDPGQHANPRRVDQFNVLAADQACPGDADPHYCVHAADPVISTVTSRAAAQTPGFTRFLLDDARPIVPLSRCQAACETEDPFAITSSNAIPISVEDGVRPVNSSKASAAW
jgi:hypothetical protein